MLSHVNIPNYYISTLIRPFLPIPSPYVFSSSASPRSVSNLLEHPLAVLSFKLHYSFNSVHKIWGSSHVAATTLCRMASNSIRQPSTLNESSNSHDIMIPLSKPQPTIFISHNSSRPKMTLTPRAQELQSAHEIRPDPIALTQNSDPAQNASSGVDYEPHPEKSIQVDEKQQSIVDAICRLYSGSASEDDMHVYAAEAIYDDPWSYCDTRYKIAGQWYGMYTLP